MASADLLRENEDPEAGAQLIADAIREVYNYPGTFADSLASAFRRGLTDRLRTLANPTKWTRKVSFTIFEGMSEIQRLVVAHAVSGLHIPWLGSVRAAPVVTDPT